MSRRNLVVPGTGGVLFQDATGKQLGSVFDLIFNPGTRDVLKCEHSKDQRELEPLATSGKPGVALTGRGYMSAAYSLMEQSLAPKWTFWDYDWRLDIRHSGRKLAQFLRSGARPPGQEQSRWHITCHSQGGLVLLWAARVLGEDVFAALVHSVVFVGVPFFGTFNALEALTEGYFINRSIPVQVGRTWPSLYQMLPQWGIAGAQEPDGRVLLNETWDAAGLFPPNPDAIDLERHIDPYLLERARATYQTTQVNSFKYLSKLRYVRVIFGMGEDTSVAVSAFPKMKPATLRDGDSLVPHDLTYQLLPRWFRDEANVKRFVAGPHSLLCADRNVYDWCV